jgi:hypothetical protein
VSEKSDVWYAFSTFELLRCILCYLQDAEKEVLKLKESLPPAILPQCTKQIHPIMQNFLTFGRGDKSRLPKGDNLPVLCTEKMNEDFSQNSSFSNVNLNKSDILEQDRWLIVFLTFRFKIVY